MQLFDTHLHLDDTQFDPIRAEVVSRADQAGVQKSAFLYPNPEKLRK